MNECQTLIVEIKENHVAYITLNRPNVRNAINEIMIDELKRALKLLAMNDKVKLIVLKASGGTFCSGADVHWMQNMVNFTHADNIQDARALSQLLMQWHQLKKPTVAMVQGAVFGGGIGLLACCTVVVAADNATFCFPEVKIGIIPAVVAPFMVNAIGLRQTKAYFLSGRSFDAQRALTLGLCHEVVPLAQLQERVQAWIDHLLSGGPKAQFEINQLLSQLQTLPITLELSERTAEKIAAIRVSEEGQEGLKAFLAKRKPNWMA